MTYTFLIEKKVNRLMNSDKISISTIPVNTHNDLPYTDLLDSHLLY